MRQTQPMNFFSGTHYGDPSLPLPDRGASVAPPEMISVSSTGTETVIQNESNKVSSHIINIDSRNRDKSHYPNPNEYKVFFDTPLHQVKSVTLVTASLPRSQTLINETNNTFEIDGVTKTMDNGNYSETELAGALTHAMNRPGEYTTSHNVVLADSATDPTFSTLSATSGTPFNTGEKYTVACLTHPSINSVYIATSATHLKLWSSTRNLSGIPHGGIDACCTATVYNAYLNQVGKIVIDNTNSPVHLDFTKTESHNPLHQIIGFASSNVSLSDTIENETAAVPNLTEQGYIQLEVGELPIIESAGSVNHSRQSDSFGKVIWAVKQGEIHYFKRDYEIVKHFHTPLSSLGSLTIKWKNWDGTVYDFNNQDHSLTIEVASKN